MQYNSGRADGAEASKSSHGICFTWQFADHVCFLSVESLIQLFNLPRAELSLIYSRQKWYFKLPDYIMFRSRFTSGPHGNINGCLDRCTRAKLSTGFPPRVLRWTPVCFSFAGAAGQGSWPRRSHHVGKILHFSRHFRLIQVTQQELRPACHDL